MEGLFYTTVEAAEELDISSARVRQLILAGAISAEKRGRDLLIPSAEIERAKQRSTSPGRPSNVANADDQAPPPAAEEKPDISAKKAGKKATTKASKK